MEHRRIVDTGTPDEVKQRRPALFAHSAAGGRCRDPRGLIANRIHIHGVHFVETGTDAGPTPLSAQVRGTTVNVVPGTTRDLEVVADAPGDWSMHRHKSHHTMNQMAMGQSRKVAERSRKEKRREPQQQCLQHGGTD